MSELRIADTALDSGQHRRRDDHIRPDRAGPIRARWQVLTGLGNTLYAVGDFHAGRRLLSACKRNRCDQTTAPLIGIARVAIHQRRFGDAISTYRRGADAQSRGDPLASAGLGAALGPERRSHGAHRSSCGAALKTNPGDPVLSANLGFVTDSRWQCTRGCERPAGRHALPRPRRRRARPGSRAGLRPSRQYRGSRREFLDGTLPKASVQDNLRYYEIQRNRLLQQPVSSTSSAKSYSGAGAVRTGRKPPVTEHGEARIGRRWAMGACLHEAGGQTIPLLVAVRWRGTDFVEGLRTLDVPCTSFAKPMEHSATPVTLFRKPAFQR